MTANGSRGIFFVSDGNETVGSPSSRGLHIAGSYELCISIIAVGLPWALLGSWLYHVIRTLCIRKDGRRLSPDQRKTQGYR